MVTIDLTGRQPEWPCWLRRAWSQALESAAGTPFWTTPRSRGEPDLLDVLADELDVTPARIVITSGVRSSVLGLASMASVSFVEQPTFAEVPALLKKAGKHVVMGGWDALEGLPGASGRPGLVWVTSPARNPDGASLGPAECAALDRHAARGSTIVVNEVYRWYDASLLPSAATRVGSLSKLVGGGARVGWVIDPVGDLPVSQRSGPPTLWQRAWARLLGTVGFGRLRKAFISPAIDAKGAFEEELAGHLEVPGSRGPSALLALRGMPEDAAAKLLQEQNLLVGRGSDFLTPAPAIRLCFSAVPPAQARAAARRIARILDDRPGLFHYLSGQPL